MRALLCMPSGGLPLKSMVKPYVLVSMYRFQELIFILLFFLSSVQCSSLSILHIYKNKVLKHLFPLATDNDLILFTGHAYSCLEAATGRALLRQHMDASGEAHPLNKLRVKIEPGG